MNDNTAHKKESSIIDVCNLIQEAAHTEAFEGILYSGYSGQKIISVLQKLNAYQAKFNSCYLEIGVYQGFTLLNVANSTKEGIAYGIDNFAFFDPLQENQQLIEKRKTESNIENAVLINEDYEDALENLTRYIGNKKIGLLFIDGPHDYRSQLMCLLLAKPYLSKNAIIVVDDSNYLHVRQANRDFLRTNPEFKLLFEAYTACHPRNMSESEKKEALGGWWNGINILIKDNE